ncbi:MAG: Flp pilus assembly protein CpaB [Planctomycetota bacterium]
MRPKSIILLAIALGCGLAASIGIRQVMDANANRPAAQLDTTAIYVALHNINLGDPINASMVSLEEWPADRVPPGALTSLEDLEGRRPRTALVQGTPILEAQLLAAGEFSDPIVNIPDGFRLSTIGVNAEKSAAGLLSPGDRVDVQLYVAANARAGIPEAKTRVILQNIRVFAIEQAVQRAAEGDESKTIPKTVSLLVTPEQASKVDLAQNLGELSLIPRNPNDEAPTAMVETTAADLLGSNVSRNSREDEQNRDAIEEPQPGFFDTVMGMMKRAAEERPPFKMEIVEAEEVREMLFDPTSLTPLAGQHESLSSARQVSGRPSYTEDGRLDFTPKGSEDDFPIDLGGND